MKKPFNLVSIATRGVIITTLCGFTWAFLGMFLGAMSQHSTWEAIVSGLAVASYGVLLMTWFLIPAGCVLGIAVMRAARNHQMHQAVRTGVLMGFGLGFAAGLAMMLFTRGGNLVRGQIVDMSAWSAVVAKEAAYVFLTMLPFCGCWVGMWTFFWNRKFRGAEACDKR
jgi:hypothetical protein